MRELLHKTGIALTALEIEQIDNAKAREFHAPQMDRQQINASSFFLLEEGGDLLAMGQFELIEPVKFDGEHYSIIGIGGIVSNERRKGYGRMIMNAIKEFLMANDQIGIGFCAMENKAFYERCGFTVDVGLITRFVYIENGKRIINTLDDCVLYVDPSGTFIGKLYSRPEKDIILPRPPNW